jgi:uncharacterized repeat protein (TIGR01451 family)
MRSFLASFVVAGALGAATVFPASAATVSAAGPISVTISGADSATIGTQYPVTVVATNTTASATGTLGEVEFFVPLGTSLQGGISTTSGTCARLGGGGSNGTIVLCQLASLDPGASATIQYSVTPLSLGTLDLGVSGVDGVSIANTELSVPVAPAPTDLQVTGSASTGSPTAGSTYSYTFQVKDNGPWPAPGATFSDTLPPGLTYVGTTSSAGNCTEATNSVSCTFGDLGVGGQANVFITVQAPSTPQTITDSASVAMTAPDRQAANNTTNVTVQVK